MAQGDWIILPSKQKPAIHVARMKGGYTFDADGDDPFFHHREVEWIVQNVPRTNFDQDLLYSFGAFMTICQVSRNDAEKRVHRMAENEWKSSSPAAGASKKSEEEDASDGAGMEDLAQAARDQLAKLVVARFLGHGMARLVDAVLRATGYTTYLSPEGPDKGVDILAAPEPMGFGEPRVCVQVKSGGRRKGLPSYRGLLPQLHIRTGRRGDRTDPQGAGCLQQRAGCRRRCHCPTCP